MTRRTTPAEYKAWVETNRTDLTVVGKYVNSNTKIAHRCECGHEWNIRPSNVKRGVGCPQCGIESASKSKTYSHEQYVEWVTQHRPGIIVLGTYTQGDTKILHKCRVGHVWETMPETLKARGGCPYCAKRKPELSYPDWLAKFRPNIEVLGEYTKNDIKLTHRCDMGHKWKAVPASIKAGTGCPHCAGKHPEPYDVWLRKNRPEIKADQPYVNRATKIVHRCESGHTWHTSPGSIKAGNGCPYCSGHIPQNYAEWLSENCPELELLESYSTATTKILHRCSERHEWLAAPAQIKSGTRCPRCAEYGFNPSKAAVLYLAEHQLRNGRTRVNVGITNNTFQERYSYRDLQTVTRAYWFEGSGQDMQALEKYLLQLFDDCIDTAGLQLAKKRGTKECLKADFDDVLEAALEA